MLELNITKNELGLHQAECVLTLPPISVTRCKADKQDLEYELRSAFSDLVAEVVQRQYNLLTNDD